MPKGNNNYPSPVTSAYDMLTRFELASPRRHHTERTGDKDNWGNCGGRGVVPDPDENLISVFT